MDVFRAVGGVLSTTEKVVIMALFGIFFVTAVPAGVINRLDHHYNYTEF
jgi:hypothetical protein